MNDRGTDYTIHRSPLSIVVEKGKFVRVLVKDHAGKPIGGGAVEAIDSERHFAGRADVDRNDEPSLSCAAPGGSISITRPIRSSHALTPASASIFRRDKDQPVAEIRLPEERRLTGQVIDADNGKGLAGNLLGKAVKYIGGSQCAHVVAGAKVPILIPSRVESADDKVNAIALGVIFAACSAQSAGHQSGVDFDEDRGLR